MFLEETKLAIEEDRLVLAKWGRCILAVTMTRVES